VAVGGSSTIGDRAQDGFHRGLGVGCAHDLAHDRDAVRSSGKAKRRVFGRDPAERHHRTGRLRNDAGETLEA
jgi:hypothetical protein